MTITNKKKGRFIVFEGIDGTGKSTQIKLLADRLRKNGIPVYETREPTDSPIGSIIRQIMTGRLEGSHETIAGLFVADRLDHLQNKTNGILDKINSGITVLSDRYYFSSYAYHSTHVSMDWVIAANSLSAELLKPDMNVFLDVPPEKCIERINSGRSHIELYENLETLRAVRQNYLLAFEKLTKDEQITKINADKMVDQIEKDIWLEIKSQFEES